MPRRIKSALELVTDIGAKAAMFDWLLGALVKSKELADVAAQREDR